jgi:hypothetical protein
MHLFLTVMLALLLLMGWSLLAMASLQDSDGGSR